MDFDFALQSYLEIVKAWRLSDSLSLIYGEKSDD